MDPKTLLEAFDLYLARRKLRLEAVVIGGAALNLLGIVHRTTKDCDILHPSLSAEMIESAQNFAKARRDAGETLADDWLNNGPQSLAALLPAGWQERLVPAFKGQAIELKSLGRLDLLRSKVFSLCDRALDLQDCLALAPAEEELALIEPWLSEQDGNPEWTRHVHDVLKDLKRRLGHGV